MEPIVFDPIHIASVSTGGVSLIVAGVSIYLALRRSKREDEALLTKAREEAVSTLDSALHELREQVEALTRKNERLEAKLARVTEEHEETVSELKRRILTLESQTEAQQKELATAQAANTRMTAMVTALEEENVRVSEQWAREVLARRRLEGKLKAFNGDFADVLAAPERKPDSLAPGEPAKKAEDAPAQGEEL